MILAESTDGTVLPLTGYDLRQVSQPLYVSVSSSVKWDLPYWAVVRIKLANKSK